MSQLSKLEQVAATLLAAMLTGDQNASADRVEMLTSKAVTYAKRLLVACQNQAASDYVGSR